jgi:hypothetical protein
MSVYAFIKVDIKKERIIAKKEEKMVDEMNQQGRDQA